MESSKNLWSEYARWVIVGWILVVFVRIVEVISLNYYHYIFNLIENELLGIGVDLVMVSAFFAFLFPVFYLFSRLSSKAVNIFMGVVIGLLVVFHLAIIQYFIRTFVPLGGILMGHTLKEIFFTVRSVETNYFLFGTIVFFAVALMVIAWNLLKKWRFRVQIYYAVCIFSAFAIFINMLINNHFDKIDRDFHPYSLRINKSDYFYRTVFSILLNPYTDSYESINLSARHTLFPEKRFVSDDYPLLSETDYRDVLGAFFDSTAHTQLPNIVVIIVEGLGSRFLPDFHGLTLMPFLDSLTKESLYWDKALTIGERSFSVVPALLASSPHGKSNFARENDNLLSLSLVNMLSKYNYYSTFFYGQPKWFHNKGHYLSRNGLNKFVDCHQFPEKYSRIMFGDYFWGHHDQDLVQYALEFIADSLPENPRLDIYFTGSMHQPFVINQEDHYNERLNNLIQQACLKKQEEKFIRTYWKYVRSVLFSDDALRKLFAGYQQQPSFQNTIFIITGDHPMSEIPVENSYMRYRTPIIVYSPMLKQSKTFNSVNSHLDIAPTLLAFLHHNYGIQLPSHNAFLGKMMDTATCFRNLQPVVFMNGSRLITDILHENYFLSNEKILFKIHGNDNIERIEDEILKEKMYTMLHDFRTFNMYCCANLRLIPDTLYYHHTGNTMIYKFGNQSFNITKDEWGCSILPEIKISDIGQYFFDFLVNDKTVFKKDDPIIVLELFDSETGELISWNGFNLLEQQGFVHFYFYMQQEKGVVMKACFWNNQQTELKLSNTNCRFYRLR